MKCYQIWMKVLKEDDEDWYSCSVHTEYMPYSKTIYTDKNEANSVMNNIDKRFAYNVGGLSASRCTDLYLREFDLSETPN